MRLRWPWQIEPPAPLLEAPEMPAGPVLLDIVVDPIEYSGETIAYALRLVFDRCELKLASGPDEARLQTLRLEFLEELGMQA